MKPVDLLITNARILTMSDDLDVIEDGLLAVRDNTIVAVEPQKENSNGYEASKYIDARGGLVMPGLINAHTHAAMTCFRGLADDLPLMDWLENHIFPAESKLTSDWVYKGTLLACAEMIASGTTTFCDMYLYTDFVARAAKDAGLRAVVGEVLYDFDSPNYGPIEKGLQYTQDLIDSWRGDPLIRIAVEPHSAYLCSPELLAQAKAIGDREQVSMVIHLSESEQEVQQVRQRYGKTPVEHLAQIGFLGPRLVADHCVALTDKDMDILADHQVKVAHNPESNMKLASGVAPIPDLLKRGVTVGIGTDGCASNNDLDLFQEMDTLAKIHKVHTMDPTVLDAATVLGMATRGGAKVLAMEDRIGVLAPGKQADIIILDTNQPHLVPMYNPYSHLVYVFTGGDVRTTIVAGRVLMEDRRFVDLDVDQVMADVNEIARTLRCG